MDEPGTPAHRFDGTGHHPLSDCEPGACCAAAGDAAAFRQAEHDAAMHDGFVLPASRQHAPVPKETLIPFVVQSGRCIYMLASEHGRWVLAELRFDEERVTFLEIRRSTYEWPREAFGALLSRVALRDPVDGAVDDVARDFHHWLGGQFIAG